MMRPCNTLLRYVLWLWCTQSLHAFLASDHHPIPRIRTWQQLSYFRFLAKVAPIVDDPDRIRNVALIGHSHAGKTTLVEWMLWHAEQLAQKPRPDHLTLDFDTHEVARHATIFSHFGRVPHLQYLMALSDTPWGDFPADATAALDGADAAVLVVSAADSGSQDKGSRLPSGAINAWQHCQATRLPTLMVLSKMDRPFVSLPTDELWNTMQVSLGTGDSAKPLPLQVVRGTGSDFAIDPLFHVNKDDGTVTRNPDLSNNDELQAAWSVLEEAVSMVDDDLLEYYMDNGELTVHQVWQGLRTGVRRGKLLPVVFTAAEQDKGVQELMDAMVAVLPSPLEMRQDSLSAASEIDESKKDQCAGVENGFAARVLHTTVDSFGSYSVLRIISNSRQEGNEQGPFDSFPNEAVIMRTGEKIKMPSSSTAFALCGKDRLGLPDGASIVPGDILALPKFAQCVQTNDVVVIPTSVEAEQQEIEDELLTNVLSPLSRPIEETPLMSCATVQVSETSGKKSKGSGSKGSPGADDKLSTALAALAREDLALHVENDAASGKLLIRCMSGDHLDLITARLADRYGLHVELGQPPVPYRETLVTAVHNIEGKHKKQSGGSGQFGVCYISMEPLETGTGIEFVSKIKGGVISKPFISSVEKGVREQLSMGGPMGFPVTDVRVTLTDGKMHTVDSKDIAFQMAGKHAVKAALEKGKTKLMQPMELVTFTISEKLQGEVNSIVSRQEGYVTLSGPATNRPDFAEIEAIVPTASIAEISDALRAESAGEGQYRSKFSHYQAVSDDKVSTIVDVTKLSP